MLFLRPTASQQAQACDDFECVPQGAKVREDFCALEATRDLAIVATRPPMTAPAADDASALPTVLRVELGALPIVHIHSRAHLLPVHDVEGRHDALRLAKDVIA